jgi:hypothetical protein
MAEAPLPQTAQGRQAERDWYSWPDRISHAEAMRKAARDTAVAGAMEAHAASLRGEIDRRIVMEIAQLAVHTALLQYSTYIETDIARIESADRARFDEMARRPMPPIILDADASADLKEMARSFYDDPDA